MVLVGERKDSQTYVRNKKKACEEVGIVSYGSDLPETATEEEVLKVGYLGEAILDQGARCKETSCGVCVLGGELQVKELAEARCKRKSWPALASQVLQGGSTAAQ